MVTRNDIINGAFQLIGEYSPGETISGDDISVAVDFLNEIVRELAADGLHLWQRELISFTPTIGQEVYTIGPASENPDVVATKPLTVHDAFIRDTTQNFDTSLVKLSRNEYMLLASKKQTGRPNQFYYQPLNNTGKLYLFPAPDATSYDIYLDVHTAMDTFDSASDEQDFPTEWTRFLKYALARDLGLICSIPDKQYQRILMLYQDAYARLLAHDSENASVFFMPDTQYRRRK